MPPSVKKPRSLKREKSETQSIPATVFKSIRPTKSFLQKELTETLSYWPDKVSLAGATFGSGNLTQCADFPHLAKKWTTIEAKLEGNEIRLQLCWFIYGELHIQARKAVRSKVRFVHKVKIQKDKILNKMKGFDRDEEAVVRSLKINK